VSATLREGGALKQRSDSGETLLLWDDPKERQAIYRILAATGASVHHAASWESVPLKPYRLVVMGGASLEAHLAESHARLAGEPRPPVVLVVTDSCDRADLLDLFAHDMLGNSLVKGAALGTQELVVTVQKLVHNDIFGLEKYLTWGTPMHREQVRCSAQKDAILEGLESYLRGVGCNHRLLELARGVADELVMNAIYDAPVDEHGAPKYSSRSRGKRVDLEANEEVTFTYACDGRNFGVSVIDNFGRLERRTVLGYLRKCTNMGADQIDDKPGGAGLGLYYVFESVNSLVINLARHRRTEMIGIMDVSGTYRDFANKPKSLHLFLEKGAE